MTPNELSRINHITLAVSNLERSSKFYAETLGFLLVAKWRDGVYLLAGELWICLAKDPNIFENPQTDCTHVAFDVKQADFQAIQARLFASSVKQWKTNSSEGDSFYFLDPDGHKLEIHVGDIWNRIADMRRDSYLEMELFEDESKEIPDSPGEHTLCITSDKVNFRCWKTKRLWEYASELPIQDIEISSLLEFSNEAESESFTRDELAQKAKRIMEADLSYPIILSADGWLFDGGHRTMKALALGKTTIRAVRFTVDPEPDYWRKEERELIAGNDSVGISNRIVTN